MERPKVELRSTKRDVTGEVVYLDDMRRAGQQPKPYLELSDAAIQMYENQADLYTAQGIRPEIIDAYELCTPELTPLEASCREMIRELSQCNDEPERFTFVNLHTDFTPEDVLSRLQAMSAGELLADSDEQLAMPPNGYWPEMDIKKSDSQLVEASLTVWQWHAPGITRDPTVPKSEYGPRSLLYFPSDELQEWGQLDVNLVYVHPQAGVLVETVSLYQGIAGNISLHSKVWMSVYAETGYEGHGGKSGEYGDEAIAEFADLVAELVGDEPISQAEHEERQFEEYLKQLVIPDSRLYLGEYADNVPLSQILYDLEHLEIDSMSLREALVDERHAKAAQVLLVERVNAQRLEHNRRASEWTAEQEQLWGVTLEPWHDQVAR